MAGQAEQVHPELWGWIWSMGLIPLPHWITLTLLVPLEAADAYIIPQKLNPNHLPSQNHNQSGLLFPTFFDLLWVHWGFFKISHE